MTTGTTFSKYSGWWNYLVRNKKLIFFLLKLFIAAGLLVYIINSVKPEEIVQAIQGADTALITAAFILSFLNLYLQYIKWRLTCGLLLNDNSRSRVFRSLMHGFAAGVITPARIGEYFGRALAFKDKPVYKIALATLLDKFFPLLMVAVFGSVSSILFIHYEYGITPFITAALFIVLFSLFYFAIYLLFNERFWNNFIFVRLRKSERMNYLLDKVRELKHLDRSYSFKMLLISFLFYLTFLTQYALLVAAFSNHFNIAEYLWAGNLIMFAKTIIPPVSLGELGIREGASVYFISRLGESASVGFNASIFLFLINVLLPSVLGLILMMNRSDD